MILCENSESFCLAKAVHNMEVSIITLICLIGRYFLANVVDRIDKAPILFLFPQINHRQGGDFEEDS